jgi:hypothetical protein
MANGVLGAVLLWLALVAPRYWSVEAARCEREMPRVREAEAGITGGAFGERCGEHTCVYVVVVVNLGGGLAGVGAQDPAGVLDEAAFEGDWRGEEQSVESWAVEALADVGPGGDHEQRWPVRLGLQAGEGGCACFGAHAAAQDHWVASTVAESAGELLEVASPLG